MEQPLDVEALVDGQRFRRFNANLLLWSFLAMLADGFDISSLASAAPQLARTWHIPAAALAPALSASLFGILFGAPLLGYVGDRFGRKRAIVAGSFLYGLATLGTVWSSSLDQIVALRALAGIGIGGLMPNTIALTSELSPRRLREMLIVLMFTGITTGSGVPGLVQAWLIPHYGWPIMFWIGGLVPLLVGVCLIFALPESVKHLAGRPERRGELLSTLRRLRRDVPMADDAQVSMAMTPRVSGTGLAQILGRRLAWVTPILWLCFLATLMADYAITSWLPTIFENNGLSAQQSGLAVSCYHYGGTVGGVIFALLLGRFGFSMIGATALIAAPAIAAIGLLDRSFLALVSVVGLAGFGILGAQFGNNAAAGLIYPTAYRSRGVGWALGVGRFGSIVGPLVGGVLIGMGLAPRRLFVLAAVPMVITLLASTALAVISFRRLGDSRLDDLAQARESPQRCFDTTKQNRGTFELPQ